MASETEYQTLNYQLIDMGKNKLRVVLCHKNNILYVAGTSDIQVDPRKVDPSTFTTLPPRQLDLANFHPLFTDLMTKASRSDIFDAKHYVKRPSYLKSLSYVTLDELFGFDKVAQVTRREITTCECLKRNPHLNVAKYIGVETNREISVPGVDTGTIQVFPGEVVTGLVFERYETDLAKIILSGQRINIGKVIADVSAGLEHLHSLGFVHADVKPANIFRNKKGRFVIGDFDSAHLLGRKYRIKGGTDGWVDQEWEFAEYQHDWYGVQKVREWLECANKCLEMPDTAVKQKVWKDKVVGLL
jgi:serine/threonine protein kinase